LFPGTDNPPHPTANQAPDADVPSFGPSKNGWISSFEMGAIVGTSL